MSRNVLLMVLVFLVSSTIVYAQPATSDAICPPDPTYTPRLETARSVEELFIINRSPATGGQSVDSLYHIRNAIDLGRNIVQIEPNTQADLGFAAIYSGFGTEVVDVRFHVFINEQLQAIGDDGQTALELQFVDGVMNSFHMTIPPLETGIYDVLIAGFPNYNLPPSEPAGILDASYVSHSMRRMTLVVGDVEWPSPLPAYEKHIARVLKTFSSDEREQAMMMPPRPRTLTPSLSERWFWWVSPDLWRPVAAGETFDINLLTLYQHYAPFYEAYGAEQRFNFVLLGFEDTNLLTLGSEQAALYVEMPDEFANEVAVPITLTAPETTGQHNLVFFKIDHPRVPICRLAEVGNGDEGIEGVRVGIEVLPR